MKTKQPILLLLIIILFSATLAHGQNESKTEKQAIAEYNQSEKELNRIFNLILKTYAKDTVFIKKLKESQRLWALSRDADIELVFPYHKADPNEYGSMLNACKAWELKDITDERIDYLNQWVEGIDGSGCEGSRKVAGDD